MPTWLLDYYSLLNYVGFPDRSALAIHNNNYYDFDFCLKLNWAQYSNVNMLVDTVISTPFFASW